MSARRSRSSGKKTGKGPTDAPLASSTPTAKGRGNRKATSVTVTPMTEVPMPPEQVLPQLSSTIATPQATGITAVNTPEGAPPTVGSSQRPQRRSKTDALAKKVWSADAPVGRKRAISMSVAATTPGTATKKGKRGTLHTSAMTSGGSTDGGVLTKPGSVTVASTLAREAIDVDMSSGEDAPLSQMIRQGKLPVPPRPAKRASTMGLDYRTFVADDGGLGTTAEPGDEGGDAASVVSGADSDLDNPRVGSEDDECDGTRSDSGDDELRSDAEADELAKVLAAEKPVWTGKKMVSAKSQLKTTATTISKQPESPPSTTPARPKRATTTMNQTYQLQIDDLDNSGSSGSEFEPEENDDGELPSEEYTVDAASEDDLDDEVADGQVEGLSAGATTKAKKLKSNKASATRGPKAKQLLEQPVWKDILLAAISKSHGTSSAFPANGDLSAFAEEVHAHLMNQIIKTPVPTADSVSIPSHLGSVIRPQQPSTSAHSNTPTGNASSAPPPPPPHNSDRSPYDSDDEDDGHGAGNVASAPAPAAPETTMHQQDVAPTGQLQDKPAAEYTIVPPTQPGGTLQLMVQEDAIRTTVRHAIADLDRYLAFENGFPDAITRARVIADLLINSARSLTLDGLYDRLNADRDFTRTLSAIPKQRMSTFRGTIKKLADGQVPAFFGLVPGECKDKVDWLFFHLAYIYPFMYTEDKKTITWSAPNKGPIVRHLLHLAFCNGPTSIAAKNPDRFHSSIAQMPQTNEKEIPMPMVALVGAAIHAALSEWRTGVHKPMAFSADAFADAYNEHITLLTGIKNKNVRGYHAMMHRLYREATGITAPTTATAPGGTALDQVDFANMDMD